MQTAGEVQGFQGEYEGSDRYGYKGVVWRGELITEGGGFCGARTKVSTLVENLGQETLHITSVLVQHFVKRWVWVPPVYSAV